MPGEANAAAISPDISRSSSFHRTSAHDSKWPPASEAPQSGMALPAGDRKRSGSVEQLGGGCTARLASPEPAVRRSDLMTSSAARLAPAGTQAGKGAHLQQQQQQQQQQSRWQPAGGEEKHQQQLQQGRGVQQQQQQQQQPWGQQARGEQQLRQLAELPVSPPPWELPSNNTPTGTTAAFLKVWQCSSPFLINCIFNVADVPYPNFSNILKPYSLTWTLCKDRPQKRGLVIGTGLEQDLRFQVHLLIRWKRGSFGPRLCLVDCI